MITQLVSNIGILAHTSKFSTPSSLQEPHPLSIPALYMLFIHFTNFSLLLLFTGGPQLQLPVCLSTYTGGSSVTHQRKFTDCTHNEKMTASIISRWDLVLNRTYTHRHKRSQSDRKDHSQCMPYYVYKYYSASFIEHDTNHADLASRDISQGSDWSR